MTKTFHNLASLILCALNFLFQVVKPFIDYVIVGWSALGGSLYSSGASAFAYCVSLFLLHLIFAAFAWVCN